MTVCAICRVYPAMKNTLLCALCKQTLGRRQEKEAA